ncbi:MAG TPA: hypothetical protein VE843_01940, partial [Ktedonobacteraceae bacterium]|nr:hypothetical protein [Ktedonobacteraceae bacterium]
ISTRISQSKAMLSLFTQLEHSLHLSFEYQYDRILSKKAFCKTLDIPDEEHIYVLQINRKAAALCGLKGRLMREKEGISNTRLKASRTITQASTWYSDVWENRMKYMQLKIEK